MERLLATRCSFFKPHIYNGNWCMGKKPVTVNIVDVLTKSIQPDLLSAIRSAKTKDEKSVLKKQLYCFTPSSIMIGGRGLKYVVEHTGLMAFDIDPGGNPNMIGNIEKYFKAITQIPYTVYCGKSASGMGLWGLFRISDVNKHTEHFDAMEHAFKEVGITLDRAPSSIASLRFTSYDAEAYFNDDAEIFDKILKAAPVVAKSLKSDASPLPIEGNGKGDDSDAKNLIEKFNKECTAADIYTILENFGFQFNKVRESHYYFTRPGKKVTAGISIDYHEEKRTLYSFSDEVPFLDKWKKEPGGWSCSPMTALLLYGFGGTDKKHWAQAFEWIKSRNYDDK